MQYFGVPICPYCKKRVNIIRTWSLKRQGEYKCPRCGGISNIFLSPLIYVLAVIAILSGGSIYFFHKFILDDITLSTAFHVFLPFAIFFFLSLFMVYLAKPVIKKVTKEELNRKKRRSNVDERRKTVNSGRQYGGGREFTDHGDYMPKTDYRTGPVQLPAEKNYLSSPMPPVRKALEKQNNMEQTSVVSLPKRKGASHFSPTPEIEPPTRRMGDSPVKKIPEVASVARPAAENKKVISGSTADPEKKFRVVSSVEIPTSDGSLFSKYDDPAYVEQRLKDLNAGKK